VLVPLGVDDGEGVACDVADLCVDLLLVEVLLGDCGDEGEVAWDVEEACIDLLLVGTLLDNSDDEDEAVRDVEVPCLDPLLAIELEPPGMEDVEGLQGI
jgi:hypothetical protein